MTGTGLAHNVPMRRTAVIPVTLLCCCLSTLPAAMASQTPGSDAEWDALSSLDEGTPVILMTNEDEEISESEFVRRDQEIIVLRDVNQEGRQYRRDAVAAVWRFDPPRRRRNALLGFLIGAAVGAGMTAVSVESGRDFAHPGAMGVIGGAVGAGIGAWMSSPSRVLLYPAQVEHGGPRR